MNHNIIYLLFTILFLCMACFILNACSKKDYFRNNYQLLKDKNHIMVQSTPSEIKELLESQERIIIMFSFPSCPWCQQAIPYVNEVAKEKGYQKVYYIDIKNMRDDESDINHNLYLDIYNKIRYDIGNPDRINAPTIIVVENKEVIGYHIDTVLSHKKNDNNVLPPMTKEQIEELKTIYRSLF